MAQVKIKENQRGRIWKALRGRRAGRKRDREGVPVREEQGMCSWLIL